MLLHFDFLFLDWDEIVTRPVSRSRVLVSVSSITEIHFDLGTMPRKGPRNYSPMVSLLKSLLRQSFTSNQENSMKNFLKLFIRDERGLAAVEYALVAGVVVAGLVGVFGAIGGNASIRLQQLADALATP
jgi:pilus assembly protein Flp/PilA